MGRTTKQTAWNTVRTSYQRDGYTPTEAASMADAWFEWRAHRSHELKERGASYTPHPTDTRKDE